MSRSTAIVRITSMVSVGSLALGLSAPVAANTSAAVTLHDQTDSAGTNSFHSQNFEPANDEFDSQAADDFVVPPGQSWMADRVETIGTYLNGTGPPDSANVYFYDTLGALPGNEVASRLAVAITDGVSTGSFGMDLAPVTLGPGHYWISVQVNMDFGTGNEWGWTERTVQANDPAAWRNPGDEFGTGCTDWGVLQTCRSGGPDLAFRLLGSIQTPPPAATPTPGPFAPSINLTSNKVKEGKPVTFQVDLSAAPTQPYDVPFATQNGSAKGGKDFKATAGILAFAPGDTSESVVVKTKDDGKDEKSKETFSLQLTTQTGTILTTAKIKDNDR